MNTREGGVLFMPIDLQPKICYTNTYITKDSSCKGTDA